MTEIRICRKPGLIVHTDGGWPDGEVWAAATPERRRALQAMVDAGNQLYGAGSHWTEERDA